MNPKARPTKGRGTSSDRRKRVELPPEEDPTDELRAHYDVDYSQSRPNRFAGRPKVVLSATRGGPRAGAGRKPGPEPLVAKRVYLYPRHVKILEKIDKNLSAAIRKLVDASSRPLLDYRERDDASVDAQQK